MRGKTAEKHNQEISDKALCPITLWPNKGILLMILFYFLYTFFFFRAVYCSEHQKGQRGIASKYCLPNNIS